MSTQHKFLLAFSGPVGSGKTYLAKILAQKLNAVHIRTDDFRVKLRSRGQSFSGAPALAAQKRDEELKKGKSVIMDFDAVLPQRQRELQNAAKRYQAKFFLVQVKTPEKLILERLRKKKYAKNEIFSDAKKAISVYFIRRKLHQGKLRRVPDFVINNALPLAPQIRKIVEEIKSII